MKLLYSVGLVFFYSCKNNSAYAQWQFIAFQQMQLHSLLLSNFWVQVGKSTLFTPYVRKRELKNPYALYICF